MGLHQCFNKNNNSHHVIDDDGEDNGNDAEYFHKIQEGEEPEVIVVDDHEQNVEAPSVS